MVSWQAELSLCNRETKGLEPFVAGRGEGGLLVYNLWLCFQPCMQEPNLVPIVYSTGVSSSINLIRLITTNYGYNWLFYDLLGN
jgi:hypothetical protein